MKSGNCVGKWMGKWVGVSALALLAMASTQNASAQNVYWSVGVASPGVQVAVSNTPAVQPQVIYQRPYVVHAQPAYVHAQPVYVQPAPVLSAYPVYGRPVVIHQAPLALTGWHRPRHDWHPGHFNGRHHGRHHGHSQGYVQPAPQRGHGGGHHGAHH